MSILRSFRPSDLKQVKSLAERCLGERYDPGIYSAIHKAYPGFFLVAYEDMQLIGFVLAAPDSGSLRVLMLCVSEHYRRKGLGSALLQEASSSALAYGFKRIVLEVRVDNDPALQFYMRHGFVIDTMLAGYYTTGDDAYRMHRDIA